MNVVTLSFPAAEVDRVANALEAKGWRVSVTRVPKALRLVIMPHVTEETVKAFLGDLEGVR
jgi:tyrosine decarboxylase/aspartate 1-decarboxylase